MTCSTALKPVYKPRFLIIGYGNRMRGDDAVGPAVADTVASWNLPSTKAMSVHQLAEKLVGHIAAADYVIFVSACSSSSYAHTVQFDPVAKGTQLFETLAVKDIHSCNPLSLLDLAQQIYGHKPQAWFVQVPIESFDCGEGFSSITQRGCDQAVRTVEKLMRTYRKPVWMNSEKFMKAA